MKTIGVFAVFFALTGCATLTREEIIETARRGDTAEVAGWLAHEQSWVREEAARALGAVREVSARPLLEARLSDRSERPWVRAAAAEALGVLGDPASFSLIAGTAVQPDIAPELKISLVRALCAYPGNEALAALAPLAANEDLLVSAFASAQLASGCGRASR